LEAAGSFKKRVRRHSSYGVDVLSIKTDKLSAPRNEQDELLRTIFNQHAEEENISAGTSFKFACATLSKAFPRLKALSLDAMEGRAFEVLDVNGNGLIDREEFVSGMTGLLNPTVETPRMTKATGSKVRALAARLAAGEFVETPSEFKHVKKVAVLGAGVAGLQVANELKKRNINVVVFEKTDNVGGVWRENYADFGLQVPKELFEFPGFPYPKGTDWAAFPKGPQVQKYIELFTLQMGLRKCIRFNTTLVEIKANQNRGWTVVSGHSTSGERKEEAFDFVVVCSGMYNWPPNMPLARGHKKFKGKIIHSCMFTDKSMAEGKKAVVVGGGKSAVDCAVAASKTGASSTLLFRKAHWPVPRRLAELVPFKWGTYSRFGHSMLPQHHYNGAIARYIHGVTKPIKWAWWRIVETMFKIQFKLSGDMVPDIPLEMDVFNGGQILDKQFRDRLAKGDLKAKKGAIDRYEADKVVLTDGTEIETDLVIYGTGFNKSYSYFDRVVLDKMDMQQDGLWLYRNIIPPKVANIAFVGCEVATFNNILTHGLQAIWLAKLLNNEWKLPPVGKMLHRIELEQAWKRSWMPPKRSRACTYQLHMPKYHDMLMDDMKEDSRRKGFNLLAEVFQPYSARDYEPLFSGTPSPVPNILSYHVQDVMVAALVMLYLYFFYWPF